MHVPPSEKFEALTLSVRLIIVLEYYSAYSGKLQAKNDLVFRTGLRQFREEKRMGKPDVSWAYPFPRAMYFGERATGRTRRELAKTRSLLASSSSFPHLLERALL